jgi:hypothetical protein
LHCAAVRGTVHDIEQYTGITRAFLGGWKMSGCRSWLLCVVVLLMATRTGAGATTWKTFRYAQDRFEIQFPDKAEIKLSPTTINAETRGKIVRATDYLLDGGEYAYIVGASLLKVDVNFEGGVKSSFDGLKCKTTSSDKPLSYPKGRARELHGENCMEGTIRAGARYFTTGKWFYQILYLVPNDAKYQDDAEHFLSSFKIR